MHHNIYINALECDDDRLVGIFWADEEAIRNYATFSDIVSFDATFRSNKINHHNRCITFASGLLADETAGAYIWLLKQFKEAFEKNSEVFVTDQDPSIKITISECFPDTRHRLCMWHIMMKLGTKPHLTLIEFLSHYDTAIDCQRYIERKNDHDSRYETPAFKIDLPVEKEACKLYTRTLFFDVQDEMFASYKVEFCKSEVKLHCSCNHYEAYGLLCRHAFYVLRMNNSEVLELYQIFEYTIDRLVHDLDKLHIYKDNMKELMNQAEIDVPAVPKVSSKAIMSAMLGINKPENVLIGNLNLSKVKGTGCFSRMKPVAKVTTEELAKRRTHSVCEGKEGHNKRTCTNEPASKNPRYKLLQRKKLLQSNKLLSLKDQG
nr:hypothetical protein [Tanacetum cinerariifolium]